MLKTYQEGLLAYVQEHKEPSEHRTAGGYPCHQAKWQSKTGRIYTFTEQASPQFMQERGEFTSFSPTQIKNYPMQGFATGDIMLTMLGGIPEIFENKAGYVLENTLLPIATIHDSVLFDMRNNTLGRNALTYVTRYLETAPDVMEDVYGITTSLPFSVDVEAGQRWSDMKRWVY